jgi:hypothetical protein
MPRPQVNSNGRMPMRNGRPTAGTSADPCCCEPVETVNYYSLWPCSAPFPVNPLEVYPGSTDLADGYWITVAQKEAMWQAAEDAGDYDPLADPSTWPDYLVVTYNGYCYQLVGPGNGGCDWYCSTLAPADDPPGNVVDPVEYLGTSCDDAACDHDGDEEPDPPPDEDPDGPAPAPAEDLCGCTGKTAGTVTLVGFTTCACGLWAGTGYFNVSGNFNGTWDIQNDCTVNGAIGYILRQYALVDGGCDGTPVGVTANVATIVLLATGAGGWQVRVGLGRAFLQGVFEQAAAQGDCDGATINNEMPGCNTFGVLATGGQVIITLTP